MTDLRFAFRNVDEIDWKWLLERLDQSGEAEFWREVIREIRAALGEKASES